MLLKPSWSITAQGHLIEIVSKNHSLAGSKHLHTVYLAEHMQSTPESQTHLIHIMFGLMFNIVNQVQIYLRHKSSLKLAFGLVSWFSNDGNLEKIILVTITVFLCIFQCQNGHVACLSCWSRLSNKCHICSHDAIFARNIALEKIVESIKSSCAYAKWGCCELVSYTQRNSHEEACLFAPSTCPIPGCGYRGFTGRWSGHFLVDHSADFLHFVYGQSFEVNLEASLPFLVLLGEDDHLFLLLNKNMTPFGHAFSIVCLRTGDLNWKFSYEIEADSRRNPENCLRLKASVTNTKEWGGLHPTEAFLLVPYDFCSSTNITLSVSVGRSASEW